MAEASKTRYTTTPNSQFMGCLALLDIALIVLIGDAKYVQVTGRKEVGIDLDKLFPDIGISGLNEKVLVSASIRKKYTIVFFRNSPSYSLLILVNSQSPSELHLLSCSFDRLRRYPFSRSAIRFLGFGDIDILNDCQRPRKGKCPLKAHLCMGANNCKAAFGFAVSFAEVF